MAVRHVVMWKLRGENKEERAVVATDLSVALNALSGVVPGILSLSAGPNTIGPETNWDMVLVSEFVDEHALEAYAKHPDHLAVVEQVKAVAVERACVDLEF